MLSNPFYATGPGAQAGQEAGEISGLLAQLLIPRGKAGLQSKQMWLASKKDAAELDTTLTRLNTSNDVLYDEMGPAYLSHPNEYNAIMQDLNDSGVKYSSREGQYALARGNLGSNLS